MKGALLALALAVLPSSGDAACRLALALALDVSGSVDAEEYRLQLAGLAEALADPEVVATILAVPEAPVALAVYEWSSSDFQRLIQDWVLIEDTAALEAVRARLRGWVRQKAPEATGLGAALEYGRALLDRAPGCWERTLDVSGDGRNNDWPQPEYVRAEGRLAGIRINALVVGAHPGDEGGGGLSAAELAAYFRARVIQGADAFVEEATGFRDYARSMERKLLKELATRPVSDLAPPAAERERPARWPVLARQ